MSNSPRTPIQPSGRLFFDILLTVKRLQRSHWNPANTTKDLIECYYLFNTKVCLDELIFGYFNDQPIPSNYYNFLNYDDDNGNNIPSTPVGDAIPDNKRVEDAVVPNDEDIKDEIMINDYDSLASDIESL